MTNSPTNQPRDRPNIAELKTLWVVDKTGGRPVEIIKRGRAWLHLQPKYGWDKPRVSISALAEKGRSPVDGWGGLDNESAWLSAEAWSEHVSKSRVWGAIHEAVRHSYGAPGDVSLETLEQIAVMLGIEVTK